MRNGNFCVTVVRQSLTEKNEKMSLFQVIFLGSRRKGRRELQVIGWRSGYNRTLNLQYSVKPGVEHRIA